MPYGKGAFEEGRGDQLLNIGDVINERRRCGLLTNDFDQLCVSAVCLQRR